MTKYSIPRASLAVMRQGRLVIAQGFGDRGAGDRVAIWSLSKSITAACLAVLAQEGRLRFDDPAGKSLAGLFARHRAPADPRLAAVTVAQLLTHRSGLPERGGDDRFVAGLARLLERRAPGDATADMLMPEILQLRLTTVPGAQFAYSNAGYLLLGQIVEAASGEAYERACGRRVLASAGIREPRLDSKWGPLLQATAGWALSGPEYLAFARILTPESGGPLRPNILAWLRDPEGKWTNERGAVAYTLGMSIRPIQSAGPNLFHGGSWLWHGRYRERRGTWFVLRNDGVAWFASFDGVTSFSDSAIVGELQSALARAAQSAGAWPTRDLFAGFGIGPVAAGR